MVRAGFCFDADTANRLFQPRWAIPRVVCDARRLESQARRAGRLSREQSKSNTNFALTKTHRVPQANSLSSGRFQDATLAKTMDEYSLWLQTNVSSARQDHVRAFADDLGDRSASANAPGARLSSSGHAPARTQETSAAVGRRPSAGEEALLWRSERRDARGRRVAVPGGDTSTTVVKEHN